MNLAADAAASDATLLRLAAGGFRDMTRIAAGHPGIWPDVVAENRDAILDSLDRLAGQPRQAARRRRRRRPRGPAPAPRAGEGRPGKPACWGARRSAMPLRCGVPVPDRPGVIAEVSTLLGGLGVNIFDIEIAHSAEGDRGVLVLIVDASTEEVVRKALYRAAATGPRCAGSSR